jgi:alkanesulfonate monooxygenase SsuD/methylene tetrahydromethanopterin reductase-like flavin-dependent oxidoreductase (luciferase family)
MSLLYFNFIRPGEEPADRARAYQAALDMAEFADANGFAQIVLSEHHGTDVGWLPAPLAMAGMVLARTKTVGVSVSALILPLHDAKRVAEDMAVIDLASGGRLIVIAAIGYRPEEYAMFGRDWAGRGALMDESVQTLLDMWKTEPRPVSQPHPTLFVGGSSKPAVRRAARFGLPFSAGAHVPGLEDYYHEQCAANGTRGFFIMPPPKVVNVFVDDDPDRAWAELGEHFLAEARVYAGWQTQDVSSPVTSHASTAEELRAEGIYAVLTPQQCIDRIRGGDDTMLLHPLCGGVPVERGWDCLELYVEQVLPAVASAG